MIPLLSATARYPNQSLHEQIRHRILLNPDHVATLQQERHQQLAQIPEVSLPHVEQPIQIPLSQSLETIYTYFAVKEMKVEKKKRKERKFGTYILNLSFPFV